MWFRNIIFFLLILSIGSCKKELEGEEIELLIGEWEWVYSQNKPYGILWEEYPAEDYGEVTLEFVSKGNIHVTNSNGCVRKHRIKDIEVIETTWGYGYSIELSKNKGYDGIGFGIEITGSIDSLGSSQDKEFFGMGLEDSNDTYIHKFIRK